MAAAMTGNTSGIPLNTIVYQQAMACLWKCYTSLVFVRTSSVAERGSLVIDNSQWGSGFPTIKDLNML